MDLSDAIQFARNRDTQSLLIESAGAFWLGAEVAILFFVLAGRRHLESSPLVPSLQFTPAEKRRGLAWGILLAAVTAPVLGRGLVVPSTHALLEAAATSPEAALALRQFPEIFIRRAHTHLAIWSLFVTGWVVLEILIVWHGWKGYCRLRNLLAPRPGHGGQWPFAALLALPLVLLPCAAVRAEPATLLELLRNVQEADALHRNAMYLYLRVAGLVWIVVEWVAAVLLWRSYRLVRTASDTRKMPS